MRFFMKKPDKNKSGNFDPNGSYTDKYIKEVEKNDVIILTPPEQDADDL